MVCSLAHADLPSVLKDVITFPHTCSLQFLQLFFLMTHGSGILMYKLLPMPTRQAFQEYMYILTDNSQIMS